MVSCMAFELSTICETIYTKVYFFANCTENLGMFGDFFITIVAVDFVGRIIDIL